MARTHVPVGDAQRHVLVHGPPPCGQAARTIALGVYLEASLAKARKRREEARELLADGIDSTEEKRTRKAASVAVVGSTVEAAAWIG